MKKSFIELNMGTRFILFIKNILYILKHKNLCTIHQRLDSSGEPLRAEVTSYIVNNPIIILNSVIPVGL